VPEPDETEELVPVLVLVDPVVLVEVDVAVELSVLDVVPVVLEVPELLLVEEADLEASIDCHAVSPAPVEPTIPKIASTEVTTRPRRQPVALLTISYSFDRLLRFRRRLCVVHGITGRKEVAPYELHMYWKAS
jgi:hypothetical protein